MPTHLSAARAGDHALQPLWDLAAAQVQAEALVLAIESGALDRLATQHSAAELAQALGWHEANTAHWLELLWAMGLLQRSADASAGYQLGASALRYLHGASPESCAAAWLFRLRSLRNAAGRLRGLVEHGPAGGGTTAPLAAGTAGGWAEAARAQIDQEQRAVSVPAALRVLQQVPEAAAARHMLDLGGGPGWIALAWLRCQPALRATVFDWPEAVAVAARNARQSCLADRFAALGGDLAREGIGSGYDLVWCSSVLHFVPDAAAVVAKVFDALEPGGVFICAHAEVDDTPEEALRTLPYYLPMRVQGRHVQRRGEPEAMLARAGFAQIQRIGARGFPMAPLTALVARKAST
ncbi:methyltransferase [Paracidovorax citrulli]|uniref:Methyltransferase type 12 n=2 Tax=Paracidovorax citrulli TaxID=80869 RepID=A1TJX1_PARC0|nr:methyltransferase [Paracidovorax citrulli]ABM31259.1 Methyltransferase type 12 [Paracidovorax citrulli AAC00-1]ATG95610.1 SAM-dependent methyltransferase [Paracidovorax citrulli]MVT38027.1 methyltransferase domain-containing protein [Paracidovorax citrulli]PVY65448.1 O-methyltransferase [Paracidovorax citrulli]QCX11239.1 3-hydroxy-5-methyl-1-naphthoate 3-O-methyltransferase [Paracidovorax citrulli]